MEAPFFLYFILESVIGFVFKYIYMLLYFVYLYMAIYLSARSSPTLCDPVDCIPPGSSVHGILQARILDWVAMPSSRASLWHRNWTQVFFIGGRFFTLWATKEASKNTGLGCHFLLQEISPTQGISLKKKKKEACLLPKETYKNTKDGEPSFDLFLLKIRGEIFLLGLSELPFYARVMFFTVHICVLCCLGF